MLGKVNIIAEDYNGTAGLVLRSSNELDFGVSIKPNSLASGRSSIQFTFTPGNSLSIYITGKDHTQDTAVNNDGKIVSDKHIRIESIQLGYLYLEEEHLYAINFDPYLAFNNKISTIDIPPLDDWPQFYLKILQSIN